MERVAHKSAGKLGITLTKKDTALLLVAVMGFFVGRFVVFDIINPVAVGFVANFMGGGAIFVVVALLSGVGAATLVTGSFMLKYILALSLLVACHAYFSKRKLVPNIYVKSVVAAGCSLAGGLLLAALEGMSAFFALLAVLESSMTLFVTYILQKGVGVVTGKKRRKILSGEEIASVAVLFGAVVVGMVDIYVGNVALRLFMSTFVILTAAYKGGVQLGATAGMVLGLTLFLANFQDATLALVMSFGGLAAGLLRDKGKLFSLLGMVAGGLVVIVYVDAAYLTPTLLYSVGSGALLFLMTPESFYFNLHSSINPVVDNSEEYIRRVRGIATERLNAFSDAFAKLARSFSKLSEKRAALGHRDISTLIDDISAKSCESCSMRQYCWQTNFYETYQTIFGILGACEKKGRIEIDDLPVNFRKTCINLQHFIDTSNRLFELYKLNLTWKNKVIDSRELVSQQLGGVSLLIKRLSRDLGLEMNFREDLEEAVIRELGYSRIEPERVVVIENKLGKFEVNVTHRPCHGKKLCRKEIAPIVSRVLGRKLVNPQGECITEKGLCSLSLREEQRFRMATGVSRLAKSGSKESGDSYSFINLRGAQALLALSDGMGSGKQAHAESAAAVELLEDLIESGFEKDMALRMINSVLVLKSSEESFSTLDICSLDLYTGEAEFCKIGAATTYLLRGGSVSTIRSTSLPIGILNNVEPETHVRQLKSGDVIVMVTDGVCESEASVGWIAEILASLSSRSPQDIADIVINEAARRAGDVIRDDMTVLSARVWEK
ncbi:MAG: stage II sporulation protein E [Defluviitaleaceae bacterium]|nr:stage II sporulation protein E [Defluviitaleaceae bacterium]